ncbi:Nuclease SbcCD subunit C [compost metagenome]
MLPVRLTLKGIYSYRDADEHVVDFEKLTQDHLFGIFGAVGSGKSTILEAITFALYGDIERMNNRENRSYNMMNMRSNSMLIDFQFKAGIEQLLYRFTVKSKRSTKNFQLVPTPERQAYQWKNNDWEPLESADASKVIGISYENFKRTVIIPQGKFQEFIQLGPAERTKMMKELFNLDKFDYAQTTREKIYKVKAQLTYLEGELTGLGSISEEELQEKENQLTVLSAEKEKIELEKKQKELVLKELVELKQRLEELTLRRKELSLLVDQQRTIVQKEKDLLHFERTKERYLAIVEEQTRLQHELNNLNDQLKINQQKQEIHKQELSQLTAREAVLKQTLDNKDQQLKKAAELVAIAQLKELRTNEQVLQERISKGEALIHNKQQEVEGLKDKKDSLLANRSKLNERKPNHELLANLTDWFGKHLQLSADLSNINSQLAQRKAERAYLTETFAQKLAVHKLEFPLEIEPFKTSLQNEIKKLDTHKTSVLSQQLEVKSFEKLAEFAQNLLEGDNCPLCGSTHHPNLYASHHSTEALASMDTDLKTIDNQIKSLNALIIETNGYQQGTEHIISQENEIALVVDEKEKAVTLHKQSFNYDNFSPDRPEQINEMRASIKDWELQRDQIDKEQTLLDQQFNLANEDLKKYENGVIKLKNDLAESKGAINTLVSNLDVLNESDFESKTAEELKNESRFLIDRLNDAQQELDALIKRSEVKSREINQFAGAIENISGQITSIKVLLVEKQESFSGLLKSDNLSEDEVLKTLLKNIDIASFRIEISEFKKNIAVAEERVKNIEQSIAQKTYNEMLYLQLETELGTLSDLLNHTSAQFAELKVSIENGKKALARISQLVKDKQQLEDRKSQLDILDRLFKANGFERFISVVYLRNLCFAANERFMKFSRNQLSLELNEETESFIIRDNLNNGQVRSVKTLSGGQTFQAALSLALALADNIQQFNQGNQNFFFLDEGFGSLDKDSLHHVFETLKSLRKENRIVGLISHVDDMQQEIATYLQVKNTEEYGSIISASWEE